MKIPIKNLFYLLCYAWNVLEAAEEVEVGETTAPDLENLMAEVLASNVRRLLRRGLERDYLEVREDSKYIRGRVDFQQTVKRVLFRRREAHLASDELLTDTPANRIVKATLGSLLRFKTLTPENREGLAGLYHGLSTISDCRISDGSFYRVRLHGNNREYRLLLSICEMVHRYALPEEVGHGMRFVSFNRKRMWEVFQQFVMHFYRRRQTVYPKVTAPEFSWHSSVAHHPENIYLPKLCTDIVLANAEKQIVVDTKYYSKPFDEHFGKTMLRAPHVHQIFSYMQNVKAWDSKKRTVEGILLYAAVSQPSYQGWTLFGHSFTAAAVNLNCENWRDIEKQMLQLIGAPYN